MEYFAGKTLADLIKARGHLSVTETIQITTKIAEAIEHAHAFSVIHRDIKPSNILLSHDSDQFIVKVVDFGIAKAMSDQQSKSAQLTQTGEIFGSPAYMSPEQCLGEPVDERSDIYSLGCVMYEMLTGKSPFACDNPIQSVLKHIKNEPEAFEIEFGHLKIPSRLEKIILKCLQKDPAKRYATISALQLSIQLLQAQPASLVHRCAAALLDVPIYCFTYIAILASQMNSGLPKTYTPIATLIATSAIYFTMESFWLQASPGKFLLGLRVMDKQGQPIHWIKSSLRILVLWAALFFSVCMIYPIHVSMLLLSLPHSPPFLDSNQDVLTGALLALSIYGLLAFPDVLAPLNRLFDRVVATPNFLLNDKTRSPLPSKLQWKLGLIAIASLIFCYFSPYLNDYLDNLVVLRYPSLGTKLFYSTKSIAEGATITQSAMEEREVLGYRHPVIYFEGIPSKEELEGRVAYRQLSPGERLTYQNTSKEEAVVYALTDIPAGKVISADTIGVKKIIDRNVRAGTILSTEGVCGRTTKSGIAAGRILTCDDLLPKDSAPPIEIKPGPIEANYLGELQSKKL